MPGFLQFISIANQQRTFPTSPVVAPSKAAVIITSTHPQTISCDIKCHQRNHSQIQRPGLDQRRQQPSWFEYVVPVGSQRVARSPGSKPQTLVPNGVQHRQVALFAHSAGTLQHWQGIQLTISSQIECDMLCTRKLPQRQQPLTCIMCSTCTIRCAEFLALHTNPVSGIKRVIHGIRGREDILRLCRC